MKTAIAIVALASVAMGCAHGKIDQQKAKEIAQTAQDVLEQAAKVATGDCGQKVAAAVAACKSEADAIKAAVK